MASEIHFMVSLICNKPVLFLDCLHSVASLTHPCLHFISARRLQRASLPFVLAAFSFSSRSSSHLLLKSNGTEGGYSHNIKRRIRGGYSCCNLCCVYLPGDLFWWEGNWVKTGEANFCVMCLNAVSQSGNEAHQEGPRHSGHGGEGALLGWGTHTALCNPGQVGTRGDSLHPQPKHVLAVFPPPPSRKAGQKAKADISIFTLLPPPCYAG